MVACSLRLARIYHQLERMAVPNKTNGRIAVIDSDGNLITDISAEQLVDVPRDESVIVSADEHVTMGIFPENHDQPEMTLIAMLDGTGRLQFVLVGDSAKMMLGIGVGTQVTVRW
jgi:S-adenosylmethionine hydrolase